MLLAAAAALALTACAASEPGPASAPDQPSGAPSSEPALSAEPSAASASPAPSAAPATSTAPAPSAAPASSAAPAPASSLDLSTPEKARATIREVLRKGDKEAFRQCVTKRIQDRQKDAFDQWFAVWKKSADTQPATTFDKITVTKEDGAYKLDEN